MQLTELLPALHELPRADKLRVLQFLTTELVHEEGAGLLCGAAYPIWSPYDAADAAAALSDYLRSETKRP